MKKVLLPLLMGICLTACGKNSDQQTNKIQHYAIYCEAHYGNYAKNEYSNCGCKNYSDMKNDLAGKNIISIDCENILTNSGSNETHVHYAVIYTD